MMNTTELLDFLNQRGWIQANYEHQPVFTVEEAAAVTGTQPGIHIKNLFLRDKKKTGLWLVSVEHGKRVDLKALKDMLGARGNLSFCNAETLWEHLGVTPGAVTPLAPINDKAGAVQVFLDEDMLAGGWVNAHPLQNTMTTAIKPEDLLAFLREVHKEPTVIKIPEVADV